MLKKILLVLVVIIAAPFVAALFIKSDYQVIATQSINKPVDEVFSYLRLLKHQDEFSVWAKIDPDMRKTYRGVDGEVGFVSAWDSDNPDAGQGEQEIIAIEPGKRIDYALRFIEPFASNSKAYLTTEAQGDGQTQVVWGFVGHLDYPMNLLLPLMNIEAMVQQDLDSGLANLKQRLEP